MKVLCLKTIKKYSFIPENVFRKNGLILSQEVLKNDSYDMMDYDTNQKICILMNKELEKLFAHMDFKTVPLVKHKLSLVDGLVLITPDLLDEYCEGFVFTIPSTFGHRLFKLKGM